MSDIHAYLSGVSTPRPHAVITPEIALQIADLAHATRRKQMEASPGYTHGYPAGCDTAALSRPSELFGRDDGDTFSANVNTGLGGHALRNPDPAKAQIVAPLVARVKALERVAYVPAVAADKPALILNPHGPPAVGSGARCLMTKDQPAGDDAAVEALTTIIGNTTGSMPDVAKQVLAAISHGEVPGIHGDNVKARDYLTEISALRADLVASKNLHAQDVERLGRERDTARAEQPDGGDGMAEHSRTPEGLDQQRRLIAALRADLAAMTERANENHDTAHMWIDRYNERTVERDQSRAERAEAVALLREVRSWFTQQGTPGEAAWRTSWMRRCHLEPIDAFLAKQEEP